MDKKMLNPSKENASKKSKKAAHHSEKGQGEIPNTSHSQADRTTIGNDKIFFTEEGNNDRKKLTSDLSSPIQAAMDCTSPTPFSVSLELPTNYVAPPTSGLNPCNTGKGGCNPCNTNNPNKISIQTAIGNNDNESSCKNQRTENTEGPSCSHLTNEARIQQNEKKKLEGRGLAGEILCTPDDSPISNRTRIKKKGKAKKMRENEMTTPKGEKALGLPTTKMGISPIMFVSGGTLSSIAPVIRSEQPCCSDNFRTPLRCPPGFEPIPIRDSPVGIMSEGNKQSFTTPNPATSIAAKPQDHTEQELSDDSQRLIIDEDRPSSRSSMSTTSSIMDPTSVTFTRGITRNNNSLIFSFPLRTKNKCSERGCRKKFTSDNWYSLKEEMVQHLIIEHKLQIVKTHRFCTLCKSKIGKHLHRHACFKRTPDQHKGTPPTALFESAGPHQEDADSTSATLNSHLEKTPDPATTIMPTTSVNNLDNVQVPNHNGSPNLNQTVTSNALRSNCSPLSPTCSNHSHGSTSMEEMRDILRESASSNIFPDLPILEPIRQHMTTTRTAEKVENNRSTSCSTNDEEPADENSRNDQTIASSSRNEEAERDTHPISPSPGNTNTPSATVEAEDRDIVENQNPTVENPIASDRHTTTDNNIVKNVNRTKSPKYPGMNTREGEMVHLIFPITNTIRCTEEECDKEFPLPSWFLARIHLVDHLRSDHKLNIGEVRRWCSICHKQVPKKVDAHSCLEGMPIYSYQEHSENTRSSTAHSDGHSGVHAINQLITSARNSVQTAIRPAIPAPEDIPHQRSVLPSTSAQRTSAEREINSHIQTNTSTTGATSPGSSTGSPGLILHNESSLSGFDTNSEDETPNADLVQIIPEENDEDFARNYSKTFRNGNTITFTLPIGSSILCSEGCGYSSISNTWRYARDGLLQHLRIDHSISKPRLKRICAICKGPIPKQIAQHACLRNMNFYKIHHPPNLDFPAKFSCRVCRFSSESVIETRQHCDSHDPPGYHPPGANDNLDIVLDLLNGDQQLHPSRPLRQSQLRNNTEYPGSTCRRGGTLNLVFPLPYTLHCPEGCGTTFTTKNWYTSKSSLVRHLRIFHKLHMPNIIGWCSTCQSRTPTRVTSHPCLRTGASLPKPPDELLRYKCRRCDYSCSTRGGIMNHYRSHTTDPHPRIDELLRHRRNAGSQPPSIPGPSQSITPSDDIVPDSQDSGPAPSLPNDSPDLDGNNADLVDEDELEEPDPHIPPGISEANVPDPDSPSPSSEYIEAFSAFVESGVTWPDFEHKYNEFVKFAQDHVNIRIPNNGQSRLPPPNHRDPKVIQKLYRSNRRRAIRLITTDDTPRCSLPISDIMAHFCNDNLTEPPADFYNHPTPADSPPQCEPFTPAEVWERLRSAENTSPGSDRLTYNHLKRVDPGARALAKIFSICFHHGAVPEAWKTSRTVLIAKKENPTSASDWRPISLNATMMKLFTGCLAKRMITWVERYGILSTCQKGFLPFDGCFENNYILNHLFQSTRLTGEQLCIASLDISNAFGSIPHTAVFTALQKAGIGYQYLSVIRNLYTGSSTEYLTDEGPSDPVPITTGVRQGCPLSGLLFNISIDPLLRHIQGDSQEFKALAYADDILLIANNPTNLQESLNMIHTLTEQIGLHLNANKCSTLHLAGNPIGCRGTTFTLNNIPLPLKEDGDPTRFLGKPVGFNLAPNTNDFERFAQLGEEVINSKLAPWQVLDACKSFVFPSYLYAMRTAQFQKGDWDNLDKHFRPGLKKVLYLPTRAANEYLYGNIDDGLFNIPLCAEDSDIAHIDGAFKLLTSKDPRTKALAWRDLAGFIQARIGESPTTNQIATYLSGAILPNTTNPISSTWSKARSASTRLKVTWQISEDRIPTISIEDLIINCRTEVFRALRTHFRTKRSQALIGKPHQGKTFACFSRSPVSSHFHRNGDFTRFAEWRFIHSARLGLVPLNGYRHSADDQSRACRKCNFQMETLPHVICHCLPHMRAITARHNRIVERLKDAASRRWSVYSENRPLAGLSCRPDLVLTQGRSALILDVTCPFENGVEAFATARREKELKYAQLARELRDRFDEVKVEAVVVGALGSWDPDNDKVINKLCSRKFGKLMKKLIVSDTIRASRNIYIEHISGIPQEDPIAPPPRSRYGRRDPPRPSSEPQERNNQLRSQPPIEDLRELIQPTVPVQDLRDLLNSGTSLEEARNMVSLRQGEHTPQVPSRTIVNSNLQSNRSSQYHSSLRHVSSTYTNGGININVRSVKLTRTVTRVITRSNPNRTNENGRRDAQQVPQEHSNTPDASQEESDFLINALTPECILTEGSVPPNNQLSASRITSNNGIPPSGFLPPFNGGGSSHGSQSLGPLYLHFAAPLSAFNIGSLASNVTAPSQLTTPGTSVTE